MSLKQFLAGAALLSNAAFAAPAATSADVPTAPFNLPSTFPMPDAVRYDPNTHLVPTHFGLFGYSFDRSIRNQSFYVSSEPYIKDAFGFLQRPEDARYNQTFGSYAFGIGPEKHLFTMNDGRIAMTKADATAASILFESWKDWWVRKNHGGSEDPLPTCNIVPFFNILWCHLDGKPMHFAYCKDDVPTGPAYSPGTVILGTDTSPCTRMIMHVKQVPKTYGNQFPEQACPAYPYCQQHANQTHE